MDPSETDDAVVPSGDSLRDLEKLDLPEAWCDEQILSTSHFHPNAKVELKFLSCWATAQGV
jgi:hypothetical protein